jgi:glycogen operon protein
MLLIVNAADNLVRFTLPKVAAGRAWLRLIDTNLSEAEDEEDAQRFKFDQEYEVTPRSLLLFRLLRFRRQNAQATAP